LPASLADSRYFSIHLLALLCVYVALWALVTPYAGLLYDAQLYAAQALARLDPTVLGQDVFLRFESQDDYTIFPRLYAYAIQALGLETAAATLTLLCQLAWYAAAFLVARSLFGIRVALLSLGLLISFPGPYGGRGVFHIAEPFLSARLPAEALSLLAIWACVQRRSVVAAVLLVAAMLIHPLMAFPAALLVGLLWVERTYPRGGLQTPGIALLVLIGALAGSWLLGGSTRLMDPAWFQVVYTRNAHVVLDQWLLSDWNHTIVTLATLAMASLVLRDGDGGRVARAAFWLGITGLALTAIAGNVWHLRILIEAQPWRWLWLGRFLAIVVLPATLLSAWSVGVAGRAAVLLLSAAWLAVVPLSSRSPIAIVLGALFALLALVVWLARNKVPQETRKLLQGGAAVCLVLVLGSVALTATLSMVSVRGDADAAPGIQRLLIALNLITPAVLIVVGSWILTQHIRRWPTTLVILVAGLALSIAAWPLARQNWTDRPYGGASAARFADWKTAIPRDAEVFWFDGLRDVWFVLQRRSYLTLSQGAGVVFSGQLAAELRRRAMNTSAYIDPGLWFGEPGADDTGPYPLTRVALEQTCRDPVLGFVVSHDDLHMDAPRKEWPRPGSYVYLYDCKLYRPAAK